MSGESGWCTIESDPGVFTELLSTIGVKNAQVEELYSLDKSLISSHGQVYGLVFLFKYEKSSEAQPREGTLVSPPPETLFFANQTIQNACATQAILSIVMNAPGIDVGEELTRFRDFSNGMDPVTKGMVVGNSEVIRSAHNSFGPQQQFILDQDPDAEKEDPFHFVAYIPHNGKVYELDGLQTGPFDLGPVPEGGDNDWLDLVTPIISRRMEEYQKAGDATEIRFNLMMVVEDPRERLKAEVEALRSAGGDKAAKISALEEEIHTQDEKHKQWHKENVRRRYNFVPFIVSFLKALATSGHAEAAIKEVTEKKKTAYQEHVAKEKAKGDPESTK